MSQREYFNNEALKNGAAYTAQKVVPVYQQINERFKSFVQKRPKKVLAGMLLIATVNFALMVYIVSRKTTTSLIPAGTINSGFQNLPANNGGAAFNISNYLKISKLKDSLDYLIKKPTLTKEDSLLFIRICEEYSKLDPAFFEQVNKSIRKNFKSSNHETKTP